jgi:small nuclear ribonucleoprotein (snRNP)-like protein
MTDSIWAKYVDKTVYVILNNNYEYNGRVLSVEDVGNGLIWINITDREGKLVTFSSGEIKLIKEKG